MCLGGGGVARMTPPKREFRNRPVTVTGKQTGVDNPKDTAKATEALKIQRQKEEGTYVDPNLNTTEKLEAKTTRSNRLTKQQKSKTLQPYSAKAVRARNRDAARDKAKSLARARLGKKK